MCNFSTFECDEQVAGILQSLEKELKIEPATDWIPKETFFANLKNPFKIGLLMGPDSPEVSSLVTCVANYAFHCPAPPDYDSASAKVVWSELR